MKNRVGSFIERKGLSVYQFIKETGISTTSGYRLANEESLLPSITVLSMLCEAYRVQPTEFVYWDGD
jgi:transcriptional regulator with XRE-family HTH domain